ncbi:MAG: glutamine--fructose-6-phosphate transaminase (isomerizing) [Clostridia bacterium]|nr:glutamine--fructose-6-phosphate transaminase (isomerizing) [Clostridia bacterium]
MCGIMGCVGGDAVQKVYRGLVKLEYRGYDSAGISVLSYGNICTIKKAGMVSQLERELTSLNGTAAIGHTRWATHGSPSDLNAHPHASGKFSVVHNGIIENYSSIKEELIAEGYSFKSETDSEIVVHLLNKYYNGDFLMAVKNTVQRLKGTFALCILCADCNLIAVARSRNPIIIGRGKGCFYASSDMPALAGDAESAYVLKDGQIAVIGEDRAEVYGFTLEKQQAEFVPVAASQTDTQLCGYPHYMAKEINEIPAAVKNTLSAFGKDCENALKGLYCGVNRIILTGCGTAYHSAMTGAYVMEEVLGVPARAEIASELRSRGCVMGGDTLLIAVSQSGETADTVEAARYARERGAKVVAVTNVAYSALNCVADVVVPVRAGTEVCVAATKSYCGQIAALLAVAGALSGKRIDGLEDIASACAQVLKCKYVHALARLFTQSSGVYFIGRGVDYPVALEGSLKLKEVSYIPGEGYPAGELKHGTLALIDENTLSVAIITDRALAAKTTASVQQIRSRGGKTAVIASQSCISKELEKDAQVCIKLPDCPKYLSPIISVIPLQYAAYLAAVICGKNPDKPRNLAKSVTVE